MSLAIIRGLILFRLPRKFSITLLVFVLRQSVTSLCSCMVLLLLALNLVCSCITICSRIDAVVCIPLISVGLGDTLLLLRALYNLTWLVLFVLVCLVLVVRSVTILSSLSTRLLRASAGVAGRRICGCFGAWSSVLVLLLCRLLN